MIEPTGYCWKCGHVCPEGKLFCSKRHEQLYEKEQERKIIKGKKSGYGVTGNTH